MRRIWSALALFLAFSLPVFAESYIPDRRLVETRDIDFHGSDLQALFDTDLRSCRQACLKDPACKAFTFNGKSKACFPKSGVSDRKPFEGATSGIVVRPNPANLANAPARAADLMGFLTGSDLHRAETQAGFIGSRHPGGKWSIEALLKAADERRNNKDHLNAMRWTGAAVAQSDAADQWVEYARLSLLIKTNRSSQRRQYEQRALEAATNGYLRAANDAQRINALSVMADALERRRRGKQTLRALRLAESIQPRQDIARKLDSAVKKYGFRVAEHEVENNLTSPRICARFSENLDAKGTDYTPYIRLPDQRMTVEASGRRLCVGGLEHGKRYTITLRQGMPAASGEKLIKDVELSMYIKDRDPVILFPGRAYILPKSADAGIPIQTVNLDKVDLTLRQISDRNILRAVQEGLFGRSLNYYRARKFNRGIGEVVWKGQGITETTLNKEVTTRLPMGEAIKGLKPGLYALTANVEGENRYDRSGATQWFVLTDLGLTTMSGADGLHVFVRALGSAEAVAGVKTTLLSRSNRVLGTAETDAKGYARFAPGLIRGQDGAAPAMVMVEKGDADMAFLQLDGPAFDLSDRGVEGRAPAGAVDVFLTTDRGAYRAGETVYATALARDGVAAALPDMPLTAIFYRPDGVEYARHFSGTPKAGGHVFAMPIGDTAPRGSWRVVIKGDVDGPTLASAKMLVEDFLPERIDFDLKLPQGPVSAADKPILSVSARYLFGAPAAGMPVEGDVILRAKRGLKAFPGYQFGRYDNRTTTRRKFFQAGGTDAKGAKDVALSLPKPPANDRPLELEVVTRISEGSGRPVERRVAKELTATGPIIGIKPLFDGDVPENSNAGFQVIALGPDLKPVDMPVRWTVNRVRTRYQWYRQHGNWQWEPITTRREVATGTANLGVNPAEIAAKVGWGRYEIVIERMDGGDSTPIAASASFYAGWYVPADTTKTPDLLDLSLDQKAYKSGDTARLRLVPRHGGKALITVMSNRLVTMKAVEVTKGENIVELPVTDDWGAGAYVTANVIRPMDVPAGQNPARAIGLSYAAVDPGAKQLKVAFEAPAQSDPRGPLNAKMRVDGVAPGETAYVTVAAVDVGILNLTGFKSPDPSGHYFGQRRLGMDIRDVYGRLIDGLNGNMGRIRSGGDGARASGLPSPPPTEALVAYFSGPVQVGADGTATVSFDIPEFNGTVRLMAVAWTKTGVGQAETEVLVRDPVVVTASLPRYLSPGDQSRLLLEIVHAEGPTGRMGLDVSATGLRLDTSAVPSGFDLAEKAKAVFQVPVTADAVGDHSLRVALTTPDGRQLTKTLTLPVRINDPEVAVTRRFDLASGKSLTLDENVFAGLRPGTGSAVVSAGPLAKLNAPGLLTALDRYPYGCTEQVTSVAMPLLYFGEVAKAMGLADRHKVQKRVDQAIERVINRQASNGGFGLWRVGSGDFWLDAYVSDFLSRARAEGYKVPDRAFRLAMDNLRNRVNYAPDFDKGGHDLAYALMVLAREGAAAMADLRYYADAKAEAFATPIAAAQLGAALAMYGDQTRADAMFTRAAKMMRNAKAEKQVWRVDYGSNRRDAAAVLALATEAGSNAVDRTRLANYIGSGDRGLSTQESAWSLLAAKALVSNPSIAGLTVNGQAITGPMVRLIEADTLGGPITLNNGATEDTQVTMTTFGIPEVSPAAGGYGYGIERLYYTMEGKRVDALSPRVGERFVVVIRVKPFEKGEARLMINDPLSAGFEIDNPNLLSSGDVRTLKWLKPAHAEHAEFRADRFLAAVDWRSTKSFDLAYIVRAVSPGAFHHPAASVEDMYRPQYRANTAAGRLTVAE